MKWSRASRSGVDGVRVRGLREERKALAVRYTIDAAEAQRREELSAELVGEKVAGVEGADRAAATAEPAGSPRHPVSLRRDPGTARYVIELRATGFLWRWAIFDLHIGDDGAVPPLAFRSLQAVTIGALPRFSERSARRAAERAAHEAYALEGVRMGRGTRLLRLLH
jgi:hypothetical protein